MRQIKAGGDTTGFLEFDVKPRCDLSKMVYQYLECECLNKYPDTVFILSPTNNRILDRLFQQWLANYFYIKKQLTEVQKIGTKTHFDIPDTGSKIYILSREIIDRGYLELPNEPINIEHTKFFYRDKIIDDNSIMMVEGIPRFYWNTTITSSMYIGEKVYINWSFIQFPIGVIT